MWKFRLPFRSCGIAVSAIVLATISTAVPPEKYYRIGYGSVWPLHYLDDNGQPAGLAVGILKEAARRRGIKLQWLRSATPGMPSLLRGETDFWVAMTDLPERRSLIHITEPYILTEYCFLVPAKSQILAPADLSKARVSFADFGVNRRRLSGLLPQVKMVPAPSPEDAAQLFREGRADAVFLDQYSATAILLNRLAPEKPLRLLSAQVPASHVGIAATFASAAVADRLRDEIGKMTRDGSLAPLVDGWGFSPLQNMDAIDRLATARRLELRLFTSLFFVALLLVFTALIVLWLRRERLELQGAKAALRKSEEHYRTLIELLPDSLYVVDRDASIHPVNNRNEDLLRMNGATVQELLQRLSQHGADVKRVLGEGATVIAEELTDEGSFLEYRLVPLHDASGGNLGAMGILRDQTARHLAEAERRKLEEELRQSQKMEVVGRLAGGVAHDFNNLLTIINGYAELILRAGANHPLSPGDFKLQLNAILKAGQSAADLTQQLLAFSRRQMIVPKPCDLSLIVDDAADMLGRLLGEEISLETHLDRDLPPLLVDRVQVQQLLMNLAANARDAMPEGGVFLISTRSAVCTEAEASAQPDATAGDCVVLTAADTGEGMDAETIAFVFEPFFTTKKSGRGTGLGLATVYGIVRQNGGWIQVDSVPGAGSTFSIFLPAKTLARTGHYREPTLLQPPAYTHRRAGILLVEDREDVRNLFVGVLRTAGYEVLCAASGREALEILEQNHGPIELLVTDIVMPGMRGPELARRVREQRPETRVLFVTGHAGDVDSMLEDHGPGTVLIVKPFGPERLLEAVQGLLENARSEI